MSEIDDFRTALTAARTAVSAGSYSTARTQLTLAEICLAAIPNAGNDSTQYAFRVAEIARIRTAIDDLENRGAGRTNVIQYSKVTNKEPA